MTTFLLFKALKCHFAYTFPTNIIRQANGGLVC